METLGGSPRPPRWPRLLPPGITRRRDYPPPAPPRTPKEEEEEEEEEEKESDWKSEVSQQQKSSPSSAAPPSEEGPPQVNKAVGGPAILGPTRRAQPVGPNPAFRAPRIL